MAIEVRKRHLDVFTGIDTREIYRTSKLLCDITGIDVQPNKAIVGRNAFAHESGIHQDGVLKAPITYEIMTPESIGLPQNSIILGKHSGRHALEARYQAMGHTLTRPQLELAYSEFVKVADRQKIVEEKDLLQIIAAPASPRTQPHIRLDRTNNGYTNNSSGFSAILGLTVQRCSLPAQYHVIPNICMNVTLRRARPHTSIGAVS